MVNDGSETKKIVQRDERGDIIVAVDELTTTIRAQDHEAEAFALAFIGKLLRLRGVRIDRNHYLTSDLRATHPRTRETDHLMSSTGG